MIINEENYVDKAENVIKKLNIEVDKNGRQIGIVTTSKIRNLLAMSADIYNDVLNNKSDILDKDIVGRINYLKIRFVYESGRDPKVKKLVEKAEIIKIIDEIKDKKTNFILFNRYMEALVAYRKFYGGKDE